MEMVVVVHALLKKAIVAQVGHQHKQILAQKYAEMVMTWGIMLANTVLLQEMLDVQLLVLLIMDILAMEVLLLHQVHALIYVETVFIFITLTIQHIVMMVI